MRHVTITTGDTVERFDVADPSGWNDIAELLASRLVPGDIVALSGALGAGKTTCVQALAKAFGIKRQPPSPTFALMRSYALPKAIRGIKRLVHVDAYRIEKPDEILALDLDEELANGKSVLVLEWPERITSWLTRHTSRIDVSIRGE